LQALISQLLDLRPFFFRHVRPTLTREQIDTVAQGNTFGHGPQFPKPSDDALLEILLAMLYDPCHLDIFLVIDKLDECDELSTSQIHGFFEQLQMIPSLKFAVTTTEGHISALIPKTLQASVSYIKIVEDEDISNGFQQDLERFIHSRTLKLPLDPALRRVRTKIESFLIEKRSRSFTWVILTLQRLSMGLSSGLSTASDIDNFLKSTKAPSKTLDQVYEQVIESVHERFRNILDRALCYMASATRPMKIEELRAVLTVSEEHKSLESVMAKGPVSLKGLLSTQLGHLLKFDGDTAYLASEDLRRFIRSVLQGKRSSWRKSSRFAKFSEPRNDAFNIVDNPAANFVSIQDNLLCDQEDIHVAIAGACISLLLLWEDLRENPRRPISMKPPRTPLFLKYARDEWMYHAREAGNKAWIVSGVIEKLWQKNRDRYFPTSSKPTQQSAITTAATFEARMVILGLAPVLENNGALLDGRSPGQISTQQPETTNHSEFTEDVLGRLSIALQVDNTLFDDVLREDTIRAVSGVWNFSSPGRNPTDSKALQQLIQSIKKLKIEAQDDLFNYTVRKCMHELVKLFIIHRIAYTKDAIKFKALDIAVSVQSIEMVRRLLDSDYISRFDRDDISHALLLAAGKANEPICRLLLNHDHAIDTPNAQGGTPLHLAASTDNLALAELLIDWGANLFARDKKGCMPIHVAAESGCIPVMEFFLSIASQVAETDDDGRSPLYLACAAGQFSAAELLLSYGANVSQANNTHKIPLHAAVKPGADQIVKLLLANGTPIESRDHRGRHPLHVACMNGWALVVKDLLAAGADAEARDDDEKTPLMHACTPNSTFNKPNVASAAVVQMLLEANVEVGHSTKDGRTALHFAAEYGTPAVLQLLLEAKANPNRKDKQGKSSLHAACDAKTSFEPKMRILVRYGGDLSQEDLGKESPLATVRRSKGVDVVNRIINEKRKTSESTQNAD
jgi:ankyrin repeat protein